MSAHEGIGKSDEWYTPKYVFDALGCRFDMDVAAPLDRTYVCTPTGRFLHRDSLDHPWEGFIWMNPPFGKRNGIVPWLDKIFLHGNGIALTPDRTSAPWWQKAAKQCDSVLFVSPKIQFLRPDGSLGTQPGTGTTLLAYGEWAFDRLRNAERNKLGIVKV